MNLINQETIGRATYSEMLEAAHILATDSEKRSKEEKYIKQNLPEGHDVLIDRLGVVHILSPLYVSKI